MHIVVATPPNFEAIRAVFPEAAKPGVMFCWGDTIFSPSGDYIPAQLIAHEEVHQDQQVFIGPEMWWASYLADPAFRFNQELPAHVAEYHEFVKYFKNRQMRRDYLRGVAERLSSPLYGSMVTFQEALDRIVKG